MCDLTANRSDLAPMAVHGRTLRRESRLNLIRMRGPSTDTLFLFLFLSVSYFPPNARSPHPILPYAVHRDVPNKPLTCGKDLKERERHQEKKEGRVEYEREKKREQPVFSEARFHPVEAGAGAALVGRRTLTTRSLWSLRSDSL